MMKRREALKRTTLAAGAAALTPAFLSLLQSCQKQNRLTWQPELLNEPQAMFVTSCVDMILPATDTPGGLDTNVDVFIDKVFAHLYTEEGQEMALNEIDGLNNRCKETYGNEFADLSMEDKSAFLTRLESESGKFNGSVWGTAVGEQKPVGFYRSLKSLALWGYFTSEQIGKNVLNYDPIPGDFIGCLPLADVGNQWSL